MTRNFIHHISPQEFRKIYSDFIRELPRGEMESLDSEVGLSIERLILSYTTDTSLSTSFQDKDITVICQNSLVTIKDITTDKCIVVGGANNNNFAQFLYNRVIDLYAVDDSVCKISSDEVSEVVHAASSNKTTGNAIFYEQLEPIIRENEGLRHALETLNQTVSRLARTVDSLQTKLTVCENNLSNCKEKLACAVNKSELSNLARKNELSDLVHRYELSDFVHTYDFYNEIERNATKFENKIVVCEANTNEVANEVFDLANEVFDLQKKIDTVEKNTKINETTVKKEENAIMKNFNFQFGPCSDEQVRMSMYGLAIKNVSGTWVSYHNGQIVDVDVMSFEGGQYLYMMPAAVKDIKAGDVVIHNRTAMFVTDTNNGIAVVDIRAGETKTIIPTTNMFGFNFVTKIVSLLDLGKNTPSADQPFGNMLLPLMLSENKDIDPMMLMLLMNQNGTGFDMNNPMMMYLAMSGGDNKNVLPLMMMMNAASAPQEHKCACHGHGNKETCGACDGEHPVQ